MGDGKTLTEPGLWTEPPNVREGPVARVALAAPVAGTYSYTVPEELASAVEPGKRLRVPFGRSRKPVEAFCVAVAREPWTSTLKPVAEVVDEHRLLNDELLALGEWVSRYYCCPLGRTLSAMVPEPIRRKSGFRTVRRLRIADCGLRILTEKVTTSPHRRKVLEVLRSADGPLEQEALRANVGVSKGVVAGMVKAGWVTVEESREPAPPPDFEQPGHEPDFELTGDQRTAVDRLAAITDAGRFRAVLLFGVSASGKTEVFIRAIRAVLAKGRQAILLVPEIALTTQIVERLASRFHDVAVLHSGLTGSQRSLTWSAIAQGEKKIVIGTRSAVFAPCPDLGLIVVDEEQEASYKNQQTPRFHTRDVAIKRAQMANVPIVLASATPSLETWHNCERLAHFERIELPHRVAGKAMPAVEFVDMQLEQHERKGMHLLSRRMESAVAETLDAREQAVLLLNRRGYASYLVCSRCRNPVVCPNCRVNMVFHKTTGKAVCHYCRAKLIVPKHCGDPSCGGTLIRWGMGTQRVEEEVEAKFPSARVRRLDSDTMTRAADYVEAITAFERREVDVLVGTQMIAKGLDFPFVSFVGLVNADTSLAVPDFRAAERTFQLVTQVAGRAGRADAAGRVIVQTWAGVSATLQFAAHHAFEPFAQHELAIRRRLSWPPYTRLARVVVSHRAESRARAEAESLATRCRDHLTTHAIRADVLGPQSAPLSRLKNQYRYDFLIRAGSAGPLMDALQHLIHADALELGTKHVAIDVDPVALM